MSSTTELGYPIWDPVGDDLNENVYSYLNSITGAQSTSAMRLLTADLNALNNTKLTIYAKTYSEWLNDAETIIKSGEFGVETDTGKIKFGNGLDVWAMLPYFSSSEVLTGIDDPTSSLAGKIGQMYINTATPAIWQCVDESTNTWVQIYPQSGGDNESGYTPVLSITEDGQLYAEYQITSEPPEDGPLGNVVGAPGKSGVYYGPVEDAPEDADVIIDPDGDVFTTDNVPEGETNKYYTNERVDERLAQYKIGTTPDLPLFTGEGGAVGTKTAAEARTALGAAKAPVAQTITLIADGWTAFSSGYMQTIDVPGVRAASLLLITAHPDYYDAYVDSRVRCSVQGWDALTFAAKSQPESDIDVNVLIVG